MNKQTVEVENRGAGLVWAVRFGTQLFIAKHNVVYRPQYRFFLDKVQEYFLLRLVCKVLKRFLCLQDVTDTI